MVLRANNTILVSLAAIAVTGSDAAGEFDVFADVVVDTGKAIVYGFGEAGGAGAEDGVLEAHF